MRTNFYIGGTEFVTSKVVAWYANQDVSGHCVVVILDGGAKVWAWCKMDQFERAYQKALK